MKILIIGGGGMLGHKLVQTLGERFEVWTTLQKTISDYREFGIFNEPQTFEKIDVENISEIENLVRNLQPEVLINAVGIIKQLPNAKNVIKTLTINAIFPHRLAEICAKTRTKLISISTDCVFDGKSGNYTEAEIANAADLYGKSKHLGEVTGDNCLTLRTSIIGRELLTRHSLIEWFLASRGKKVKGFKNAIYSGFPTLVLAGIIGDLIEKHPALSGLLHVSSEPISKYDLLNLVKNAYRLEIEIKPDEEFVIDRSLDSRKFRNLTGFEPPAWAEMIEMMAEDRTPYRN